MQEKVILECMESVGEYKKGDIIIGELIQCNMVSDDSVIGDYYHFKNGKPCRYMGTRLDSRVMFDCRFKINKYIDVV